MYQIRSLPLPSWFKTFNYQLPLEVILFIMANKALISLVQANDANPTFSSLSPHTHHCEPQWLTNICTWLSALSNLSEWGDRKEGCWRGPQLGSLNYFPWSTLLPTPWFPLAELFIVPWMLFFFFCHWAFAHATSFALNTISLAFSQAGTYFLQFSGCKQGVTFSRKSFCLHLWSSTELCAHFYNGITTLHFNLFSYPFPLFAFISFIVLC